jgi:transposase
VPPPQRVPPTDAIFEQLSRINPEADEAPDPRRLTLDAKATVPLGPFARRGRSRTGTEAADHDFKPEATLTPFGILLPEDDDLTLYMTGSKVTSDCIVDRLKDWWEFNRERFPAVTRLVLNLDNGPEHHSRRTQFLKRRVDFARETRLDIELAYYPPYHSQYHPIERCWGILELHWNGALLDAVEAVLGYAESMTWRGSHPEVVLVETEYSKGVRLSREEMEALEAEVTRLPSLEKWFVSISGRPSGRRQKS